MLRYISLLGCSLLLASCATVTDKREIFNKKEIKEEINRASNYRASVISNSKTLYSDRIQCLSKHIKQLNDIVIDKSAFGQYALIDSELEQSAINSLNKTLDEKKKNLSDARIKLKKMDLKYIQMEKKDNPTEKDLDVMAKISVSVKELESEIISLKNEIDEIEGQISNYKQGLSNPLGGYASRKDFVNFQQGVGNSSKVYSVSPIYDKTAKVFPADSTAISEMVAHALSYNNAIRYMDTPFNSSWEWSRADKTNIQGNASMGLIFPSDRYISGALVQYDEDLPILNNKFNSFRLSVDPLIINKNTQVITVGLTLRMVDKTGGMHFLGFNKIDTDNRISNLENPNEFNYKNLGMIDYSPSSIYLENTFFINNTGLDLFEITSNRNYGGSISVRTGDPKMYAVREMVEKGVYELLLSTLPNQLWSNGQQVELNLRNKAKAECDIKPSDYNLKS